MIHPRVFDFLALASLASTLALARRALEQHLLYHPVRPVRGTPADVGLAYEDVHLSTADGQRLHGYWMPGAGRHALLYCHGNAGNVGDWIDKLALIARSGISVLLFDYRGYGHSTGRPSGRGLFNDARAAYDHVVSARAIAPQDLVLWGNSLGGAVAARLARDVPCRGLIIESSPTCSRDMAGRVAPWLPGLRFLDRTHFDAIRHLRALSVPKLVIHGDADPIVPFAMGLTLHAAAAPPKRFRTLAGAGHSDGWLLGGRAYRDDILAFIASPAAPLGAAAAVPEPSPRV